MGGGGVGEGGATELNFEGLEMQKWNRPVERAQIAYQKNRVICLLILFTPGVYNILGCVA